MIDVKLPESVQSAIDQLSWKHGCSGSCTQSSHLRRAIAAALLRAEVDGLEAYFTGPEPDKIMSKIMSKQLLAEADALEGK